jgi:hypothetical protein
MCWAKQGSSLLDTALSEGGTAPNKTAAGSIFEAQQKQSLVNKRNQANGCSSSGILSRRETAPPVDYCRIAELLLLYDTPSHLHGTA